MFFFSIGPEISADEAENRLQDAIQEKFAVFGDVRIKEKIINDSVFLVFTLYYVALLFYKRHSYRNKEGRVCVG